MTTSKPSKSETTGSEDLDDIEDGKPTIELENHAKNVGQREAQAEREGCKPTITPSNHDQNVGQRGGYHEHKA